MNGEANTAPPKQSVSLAGEFYTLAQLALRDVTGTLTLGNTKSVDILVANPRTDKRFKVEVKTKSTKTYRSALFGHNYEWIMGEKHGTLRMLLWCTVSSTSAASTLGPKEIRKELPIER